MGWARVEKANKEISRGKPGPLGSLSPSIICLICVSVYACFSLNFFFFSFLTFSSIPPSFPFLPPSTSLSFHSNFFTPKVPTGLTSLPGLALCYCPFDSAAPGNCISSSVIPNTFPRIQASPSFKPAYVTKRPWPFPGSGSLLGSISGDQREIASCTNRVEFGCFN